MRLTSQNQPQQVLLNVATAQISWHAPLQGLLLMIVLKQPYQVKKHPGDPLQFHQREVAY